MNSAPNPERLLELLADQAVFGLDSDETEELAKLISQSDKKDDDSFEIATAAIDLSMSKVESMPASLNQKLLEQGRAAIHLESTEDSSPPVLVNNVEIERSDKDPGSGSVPGTPEAERRPAAGRIREVIAWATAAAIGFIALTVWNGERSKSKKLQEEIAGLREKLETPVARETYNQLADREGIVRWEWSDLKGTDSSGDVVWDQQSQEGVMRIVDLAQNNPEVSQYQLWILEADGRKHPVDGGVFDVDAEGEVFIPIDAKLLAGKPAAFAITVERPGGVVVSDRKNLPLLAQAPAPENSPDPENASGEEE